MPSGGFSRFASLLLIVVSSEKLADVAEDYLLPIFGCMHHSFCTVVMLLLQSIGFQVVMICSSVFTMTTVITARNVEPAQFKALLKL